MEEQKGSVVTPYTPTHPPMREVSPDLPCNRLQNQARQPPLRRSHDPLAESVSVSLSAEVDMVGHRIEPVLARPLRQPGRPLRPSDRPAIRHTQGNDAVACARPFGGGQLLHGAGVNAGSGWKSIGPFGLAPVASGFALDRIGQRRLFNQ